MSQIFCERERESVSESGGEDEGDSEDELERELQRERGCESSRVRLRVCTPVRLHQCFCVGLYTLWPGDRALEFTCTDYHGL